jgi:hypothetical protein
MFQYFPGSPGLVVIMASFKVPNYETSRHFVSSRACLILQLLYLQIHTTIVQSVSASVATASCYPHLPSPLLLFPTSSGTYQGFPSPVMQTLPNVSNRVLIPKHASHLIRTTPPDRRSVFLGFGIHDNMFVRYYAARRHDFD